MKNNIILVETISSFKHVYAFEGDISEIKDIMERHCSGEYIEGLEEIHQEHISEEISLLDDIGITEDHYLSLYDDYNPYYLPDDKKKSFIFKVKGINND